jgi:hypothetical protein
LFQNAGFWNRLNQLFLEAIMKKIVFVFALAAMLAAGMAFAEHPSGWGIGAGFQYGGTWKSDSDNGTGISLLLKGPSIPIYWGIWAPIFDWDFGNPSLVAFGITGDYYLMDQTLVNSAGIGWFLGVGAYFKYWHSSWEVMRIKNSYNACDFGVRVPIGLSLQPVKVFEIFLDIAPSIGFYTRSGGGSGELGGGWQGDIGLRFWP